MHGFSTSPSLQITNLTTPVGVIVETKYLVEKEKKGFSLIGSCR